MPSSRLDSHQNSVQNGMVEKFTAFMATIFVPSFRFLCHRHFLPTPIPKNVVVTKTFAPKFCTECTDRYIHSSHGDDFRNHFCVCVSGHASRGNFRATFKQLPGNFRATCGQLSGNFRATSGQLPGNFWTTFGQPLDTFWTTFGQLPGNKNGR